jgi:hypothetical protein
VKTYKIAIVILLMTVTFACSQKLYTTNGETIYKTGKNFQGEKMINRKESSIPFVNNCRTCHGKNGDAMRGVSIKFKDLSNPKFYATPYTDALFYRFLDQDLKSNGTKANIGVIWKMTASDKKDLLDYLKSL